MDVIQTKGSIMGMLGCDGGWVGVILIGLVNKEKLLDFYKL